MKKRLLTVQGPLQFITGYIAFDWYRKMQGDGDDAETVLLLYDFLAAPEIEQQIVSTIMKLSQASRWTRTVFLSSTDMKDIMRGRYSKAVERLRTVLGSSSFDEIFLARNYIGDGSPLLVNAYSSATKLAYGDSFGMVGQPARTGSGWASPRELLDNLRSRVRDILVGRPVTPGFDAKILTLPLDMSNTGLPAPPLVVPSRDHAVDCVRTMHAGIEGLRAYGEHLCAKGQGTGDHLYLLSNLSASGLTTREQEIALYIDVIENTIPDDAAIFIKHHPRSRYDVGNAVVQHLERSRRVIVIDDDDLSRVPIELWVEVVEHMTIVPMFSTSAINLKFLYGKDVVLGLTPERIRRYILPGKLAYVAGVDRMIRESIDNLTRWDGRSMLWSKST